MYTCKVCGTKENKIPYANKIAELKSECARLIERRDFYARQIRTEHSILINAIHLEKKKYLELLKLNRELQKNALSKIKEVNYLVTSTRKIVENKPS